jgi:hypothetical protein
VAVEKKITISGGCGQVLWGVDFGCEKKPFGETTVTCGVI